MKQKKQGHRDRPQDGIDPGRSNWATDLATTPASSGESSFLEERARVAGTGQPCFPVPPKATDSHHHIYDARYPVDPSAQLQPPDATVADYRALQRRLGVERHVVVQPSTYGTDNRCLLDALSQFGKTARGIATVPVTVTNGELAGLHDTGVRGLRFNLEYLVGVTVSMMEPLSKRIEPLGWHIQVNATAAQLLAHRQLLANLSSPLVIDHMGQIPQPGGAEHAAFRMVEALLANGRTWVKLSGPYLVSRSGAPVYADAGRVALRFAQLAADRMLWGSDWPHPTQAADNKPDAARLLDDLTLWIPDESTRHRILVENPARLYGF
ncbi:MULTISPECIES: amidohydrolase [Paraburkholderia]|uniref:Amidohydrolase family protein n=1 Tax=Paraburkholderia madseniana TaxID=2599607 RepID=A0AAP5BPS5_9BURK|nr:MULTISPECIES: amidohydrolase family protein [Paraburkholderia]MCX4151904.1 amidohydrolase family protein [Paraburkholderia madseniana]MDN7154831.1 amidohydrolase family protein [Paraburkholderia sp. WS6]MDQ6413714.1 amidohydrolase family protein [Paraburkholderia madseniana]